MQIKEIKEKFERAVSEFLRLETYLLDNDVSERAITHTLACYLQCEFDESHVDCEYNRNGTKPKHIQYDYNRALESELKKVLSAARRLQAKLKISTNEYADVDEPVRLETYPDIIVHTRGLNHPTNLLIVEVKKARANDEDIAFDLAKLRAFTAEQSDGVLNNYHYLLGAHLVLFCKADSGREPHIQYYINGEPEIKELA